MKSAFIVGFTLGAIGSIHCISMCGPLVFSLPLKKFSKPIQILYSILYHLSRISAYVILGLILGTLGSQLWAQGVFNLISIALGVLILIGFFIQSIFSQGMNKVSNLISNTISKVLSGRRSFMTFIFLGFLNGLLPCGLVFSALSSTFLYHTKLDVVLLMLGFGLATIPFLISILFLHFSFPPIIKRHWKRIHQFILLFIAILLIVRGLKINIPILSPTKVEMIECH